MCGQHVGFPLEHRHRVCVTCVMLRLHPKLLGPYRGGDQLPEEVVEDGGRGGGAWCIRSAWTRWHPQGSWLGPPSP